MHIAVNGTDLYVEQHGSGPDIVLLHGIANASSFDAAMAEALQSRV